MEKKPKVDLLKDYSTVTEVKYNIEVLHFGDLVYVSVTSKSVHKIKVGLYDHKDSPKRSSNSFGRVLTLMQYKAFLKENGDDSSWAVMRGCGLIAIPPKRLEYYQKGQEHLYRHEASKKEKNNDHFYEADVLKTLQAGRNDLIVEDKISYDGYFYDPFGIRVMRSFYLDYIQGGIKQRNYKLKEAEAHLLTHPEASDVKIITVPYYNQDFSGEQALELTWNPPSSRVFNNIIGTKDDTHHRYEKIRKRLGLERFRKPDEND